MGGNVPTHRQMKRPVSILKSKKSEMASRFIRNTHQWGQRFYDQEDEEDAVENVEIGGGGQRIRQPQSDKTIT